MCYTLLLGILWCVVAFFPGGLEAQKLNLVLPTENDALYYSGPDFYQLTDRQLRLGYGKPWEGGTFGFVRNVRKTRHGLIYTRFHEGIDIKPLRRDRRGEPLDAIGSIDEGTVVYTNRVARHSSYGKYVVVEHWWHGSPYYSLYAHMGDVDVQPNQTVSRGERLGRMGYTGVGLNRRRAHLHLEINLMLNAGCFQHWHQDYFTDANHHGVYNGLNMAGIDVARLYLTLYREEKQDTTTHTSAPENSFTLQDFIQNKHVDTTAYVSPTGRAIDTGYRTQELVRQEPFFKITIPNQGKPELLWRYPWLLPETENPWMSLWDQDDMLNASWEFYFIDSGLPVRILPTDRVVYDVELEVLHTSPIPYAYLTKGMIRGTNESYALSNSGKRYIDLLTRVYSENLPMHDDGPALCKSSLHLDIPAD